MKKLEGTYVGYRVSANDADSLYRFLKDNSIPCDRAEFHVTVLYSRKNHLEQFQPNPDLFHIGFHEEYGIFDNGSSKCLVIRLRCPSLLRRHQQLMDDLQATYDFPIYYPHITVCDSIPDGFSTFKLPKFRGGITINGEYSELLELDWKPETSDPIPVREVLDNPEHPLHEEVADVFEKLERGEIHLTGSLGDVQEPSEPEKAELISALDRLIERSGSDEEAEEEAEVSSGEVPEEAVEAAAEEDRAGDQELTVEPGGGAFPFTIVGEAPELPAPEHTKTPESDEQLQRPVIAVVDAPQATVRQNSGGGFVIQKRVKKKGR